MHFATIQIRDREQGAILSSDERWVPLNIVDSTFEGDLLAIVRAELDPSQLNDLTRQASQISPSVGIAEDQVRFAPPFRHPRKIWGIGLNFQRHAEDLKEPPPLSTPASFIKADHTIIGIHEKILLPEHSNRVTTEAELGIIIGREARAIREEDALSYVFGFVPILDQTAEDILEQNPRFLTRSKNFETFFSFGPEIISTQSYLASYSLSTVSIRTIVGNRQKLGTVAEMRFSPSEIISFHSQMMPLYPGDIISPGTPGALVVEDGDIAEAVIDGFRVLRNPVSRSQSDQYDK